MTPDDAAKVLTLIAVYDNRSFEKVTAHAWADALDGLELADCLAGVKTHFRRSKAWLMPADLRESVRGLLVERRRVEAEHAERLALECANNDPAVVAERADLIRRIVAEFGSMPAVESPHPSQDTARDRKARKVACPWCKQPAKAGCVNTSTGQPAGVTHELRLIAAGLVAAPVSA
jgi:hypothetical protein